MQQPLNRLAAMLVMATAGIGLLGQSALVRAKVSATCPNYLPVATMTGVVDIPGSDDLADVGQEWNHGIQSFQSDGGINYQAKATLEVVKNLVDGSTLVGITDREFTEEESNAFKSKFGYAPMRFPVCLDANIVYVNKDNPLTSITMEQLDAIYSKARLGGGKQPLLHWSDLGVKGNLGKREINAYSPAAGSAARSSFASLVMRNGEFRPGIFDKDSSAQIGEAIKADPAGIAYGSLAAWYSANKVIPVVPYLGAGARFPDQESITSSKYPMPRLFYVYLNRAPGKPLEANLSEVLHYILSSEGQNVVADVGIIPGPVAFLTIALKRLDH
jgi:phosphate transport system substrate-binding protein